MAVYEDENKTDENSLTNVDLSKKERTPEQNQTDRASSQESGGLFRKSGGTKSKGGDIVGKGLNVSDNYLPAQARVAKYVSGKFTRKNSIVGALVGTITAISIFAFTILQGPLQLVHLSQILRLNMFKNESDTSIRARGIYASARTGNPGYTRVGTLGQWRVNKTIGKLDKMGVKIRTTNLIGNPSAMEFDLSNKDNPYHGMAKEEAIKAISKDFGIDAGKIGQTSGLNGIKISVNVSDIGERALRGNNKVLTTMTGDSKILQALDSRTLNKFFNVNLHPLNKLENKAARKDIKRSRIKAEEERQKKIREPTREKVVTLREKLAGKVGERGIKAGAFALAGTEAICVVHDISGLVPEYNKAFRDDSISAASDMLSVGEQIRTGQDFSLDQAGGVVQNFQDKDGKSIWTSKPLQATSGVENPTGEDIDKNMKQAYTGESSWNDIHSFTGNIPGVDIACSTGGQIAMGAIGIASLALGPGGVALNATKAIVGGVAGVAVMNLATKIITPDVEPPDLIQGPVGGSFLAYGSRAAANATGMSHGGTVLSDSESAAVDRKIAQESKDSFQEKSFFARTFDIYDYRSVASTGLHDVNMTPRGIASFFGNSFNPVRTLSKLSSTVSPRSSAANNYNWGFNRVGMNESTLKDPKYADSVDNAEKAINAIKANSSLGDRAKACFGVELNSEQTGFTATGTPDQYGEDYQNANCSDDSEMWTRVRLAVFDDRIVVAGACYESDDSNPADAEATKACEEFGFGSSSSDTPSTDSSTVLGAPKDLAQKILDNDKITKQPNPKLSLDAAARGNKSPAGIDKCGKQHPPVDLDPKLLAFLAVLGEQDSFTITSLTTGTHACTSNHYKGVAVDFGCDLDTAKADDIGKKYGIKHNFESCSDAIPHWHYSVGGG